MGMPSPHVHSHSPGQPKLVYHWLALVLSLNSVPVLNAFSNANCDSDSELKFISTIVWKYIFQSYETNGMSLTRVCVQ